MYVCVCASVWGSDWEMVYVQVAAAVFAFRGTRLTKAGTVSADIQLIKDRNAELYITQRAMKHVVKHIRRLHKEHPDVQWGLFTTGMS